MTRVSSKAVARLGTVVALGLIVMPQSAFAARASNPEVSMRRLEKRVSTEKKIQLETTTNRFELQRPWLSAGTVGSKESSFIYQLDNVRAIHAYRNYTGRGAGIGILAGMALGGALGAYSSAMTEPGQRSGSGSDFDMGLVAAGGAAGAVVGLLVGTAFNGWKKIYEHPAEPK